MNNKDQFESASCNCVEVGTLIREEDTGLVLEIQDEENVSAEERFQRIKQRALSVGSGNCKINSETVTENGVTTIKAMLDFDCAAEKLIFEMTNR